MSDNPESVENSQLVTYNLDELFQSAQSLVDGVGVYVNNARFRVSQNELIIDLYLVVPTPDNKPKASLIQRIIMPLGLGKGFVTGMANAIALFEKATGIVLVNQRQPVQSDEIKIW